MENSVFAQALAIAKAPIVIFCERPNSGITINSIEQGLYHFHNCHGVQGEISEKFGFDAYDNMHNMFYVTVVENGSEVLTSEPFETYTDAKLHAKFLK